MGTTYQVICDRCSKSYLTTDDTPPLWCGCGPLRAPAGPGRPECIVGHWPLRVSNWREYTLPDVPESEQCYVTDPDDRSWFFCVRKGDVPALHDWLKWYHASKAANVL